VLLLRPVGRNASRVKDSLRKQELDLPFDQVEQQAGAGRNQTLRDLVGVNETKRSRNRLRTPKHEGS